MMLNNRMFSCLFFFCLMSGFLLANSFLTPNQLSVDDGKLLFQNKKLGLGKSPAVELDIATQAQFRQATGLQNEILNTPAGSTVTIDWNLGNKQRLTVGATNLLVSFSNISSPIIAASLTLLIAHTGAGTITWSPTGTFKWPSGHQPALSVSNVDVINFYYYNGTYYGVSAYNFY